MRKAVVKARRRVDRHTYLHAQGDDAPVHAEPNDALLGAGGVHLVPRRRKSADKGGGGGGGEIE